MAIYAIGDIQGCFDELLMLLEQIDFDRREDQLWFTGDLVNRGPKSLEVLRFVKGLGDAAVSVLGNHDLHLLAAARNGICKKKDTLEDILSAADRDELLSWLRHRPLLHYDEEFCLIHAGLSPHWDLDLAMRCASEVQGVLQGPDHGIFLDHMYGDTPHGWDESLEGWDRLRFIINCFTRMRYCDEGGRLDLKEKGPPGSQPKHLMPWFEAPNRKSTGTAIVFGHWSTLGFSSVNSCYGLDTGCLWGGQLTALRLDGEMFRTSIACPGAQAPGL